ncbi:hypothetical protein BC936DRAFT_148699 [Jimgerdemannia flammicorona]|uniref:Uncharacterized protein n=1 Tax=Jimgerdemannia flammicorona TaxID=994334 RepID=A0A433D2H6_9FUNG|nr:hypothetical protein BC936DRAFT_148699 [Jimgerdemannia flammicorona]
MALAISAVAALPLPELLETHTGVELPGQSFTIDNDGVISEDLSGLINEDEKIKAPVATVIV